MPVLQVIIKKFEIGCPLPEDITALNESMSKVLNISLSHPNTTAVDYSEDACTPKYFVYNTQVSVSDT